jgi:chromosome segregation ATPase
MQKEFKDKLDQMSKAVLARDLEIAELKERLDLKLNIDEREKEHLVDAFRKWQGRKPNSANDYKVMSVINHYENQLAKLTRQIEQLREDSTHHQEINRALKQQLLDKENRDINIDRVE